ncbi:L-Lysine-8-amino-7-oxononanoate aminotransferase [Novipirellula aureliae]|uniref:Adenosylmethionine-8-amino-7-oxononanoate aminotransferase n=1 Tax=Novipirellula aureliae TaxID=2527966 RepID=A0A5C6EDP4_9BACT|nr:adenosylmethionine--8-amino-7-oxononanoate transaminase [Novipirellula aureliae]TWU45706.1 L-Lysine-8-amino-7-oxononanoate aminotransferase [Novipirellula aureliae]
MSPQTAYPEKNVSRFDTLTGSAHWQGFTQMSEYEKLVIAEAEGCWLTTTSGDRVFDGVSSLWCNVHGHRHPKINAAIEEQLHRVAHITTLGMSADVTEKLAEKIVEITPGDLGHVFFSSDGSSSVEAALKMALQYWHQRQHPRPNKTQYLALSLAYHGDTTGAVSLGGIKYFHQLFAPIVFRPIRGPLPCSYRLPPGVTPETACDAYADEVEQLLKRHHETIAAVVMEPLVQGAAGMITHPHGFLSRVRKLCDDYDVLLICDEVATGFGRTGKLFACEHESVTPDILCLGKGLTGGYLPMAATVARPHLFEAFLAKTSESKQFFHGHTFGGNPLAAAAAIASIDLFEETNLIHALAAKTQQLRGEFTNLHQNQHVGDIRGRGMMVGIELVQDRDKKTPFDAAELVGARVCKRATDLGVWIRPLGDVVIVMPPLAATDEELEHVGKIVCQAIADVTEKG